MAKGKFGLGKGLNAIFLENNSDNKDETVTVDINEIEPNKDQPRREFSEEGLKELSESIMHYGVLQPILVKPNYNGGYQIVAGERRYRAARMAGFKEIPVVIRELNDSEVMEIALIENLQREDLTDLEEAQGYKSLIERFNYSQEKVSEIVCKSRSAVTNSLRLLSLPDEIKELLNSNKITAGHARALLSVEDKERMLEIADMVVKKGLSVRETEKLCKKSASKKNDKKQSEEKPAFYREVEMALSEYLGKKVSVTKGKDNKSGTLSIEFYSEEELRELANKLEDNLEENK